MLNKIEAVGVFVCVGVMALALFVMNVDSQTKLLNFGNADTQNAAVVVSSESDSNADLSSVVANSVDSTGTVTNLIVDDVILGKGKEVKVGDTVTVNYIGTLQNGQQFDNSYTKGTPFTFVVGQGQVIKGWDQGLVGMKAGGQRILVIPAELAYGNREVGPIPANSTLVFAVELVAIK